MHALVTGGGGFLGGYIVEALLARGDRVRSFGRGEYPKLGAAGVEVVRGDLRDNAALGAACAGIDCVFHAAAIAGIGLDRDEYVAVNQRGTELLLSNARQCGVKCFVYTSSPSVVFAGVDQCGVDESAPYDFGWMDANRAFYSYTKACAEQAVLAANSNELRTCALRPHLIWGPRDTHLIPRLVARARAGRLRRVGDGTNLVDVTYVENAAEAHVAAADALASGVRRGSPDPAESGDREVSDAAEAGRPAVNRGAGSGDPRTTEVAEATAPSGTSDPGGKAYFISQGEAVNCWQWIDEVLALAELPPVERAISRRTGTRIGAKCESIYRALRIKSEPPMTRFLAAQLSTSHWFDIGAARRDFGYEPRVSTGEGMRRVGEWLREER